MSVLGDNKASRRANNDSNQVSCSSHILQALFNEHQAKRFSLFVE